MDGRVTHSFGAAMPSPRGIATAGGRQAAEDRARCPAHGGGVGEIARGFHVEREGISAREGASPALFGFAKKFEKQKKLLKSGRAHCTHCTHFFSL